MAEVNVKIKAQNQTKTGFQQALGDAKNFGSSASSSLKSSFAGVANDIKSSIGGALAGLASIGAIKSIIDQFGRIQDLSEQFGVSAESLQRFGQLASEGGSSVEQIAAAFSKLTINIQKAQGGTGEQADALRELGLSAKELSNLSPEQVFLRLADAVQKGGGSNASYAAALVLIGNRQRDLIPLLAQGADAIGAQAAAIDVASADTIAKVDAMGDKFSRLGQQIAVGLGPAAALIGQVFLSVFAIVESVVGKLASSITSSFLAVGQVLGGNFKAAGQIMRGEADATAEQWGALQKKISQINSTPPEKKGKGALGAMEDNGADSSSAGSGSPGLGKKDMADKIGEQQAANYRAALSNEQKLQSLKTERLGIELAPQNNESELKRLQITGQIEELERSIAEKKKQGQEAANAATRSALSSAQEKNKANRESGMSLSDRLNYELQGLKDLEGFSGPAVEAQKAQVIGNIMSLDQQLKQGPENSFQGSSGASSLQRIGFASNEFFDTSKGKKDPAEETKRAADLVKEILAIIKKGEPLVLPTQ